MLCRPRSRSRLLRRLRRPLRPLLSSMFRAAGVRGRKVPPRGPSVPCEGHHSPSVSMVCGHPAALRSSAAGSLPLRKSAVPQASQLTSSAPAPRYGFAVVIPGRYSYTPPPGKTPPEVFRASRRQPFRLQAQTVSEQVRHRLRREVSARQHTLPRTSYPDRASEPFRLRPGRPSALPHRRSLPLLQGA